MIAKGAQWYPVVAASFDHGLTFPQVTSLVPPDAKNWGDRDFIAVGPDGTVYVTWDYGPDRTSVTDICATNGSCAFATGDLNVVMQRSTDGGKTFSPISTISPGFPASGGDIAPLVIEPNGRDRRALPGLPHHRPRRRTRWTRLSVLHVVDRPGLDLVDAGPRRRRGGTMSLSEWWIDGDIGIDAGGNLYATWDTQGTNADGSANDTGWLSFSTDHGARWSAPVQAPPDQADAPHIMEVVGGARGTAYVGWLSGADPRGYAAYLRTFSIAHGWLTDPLQLSPEFGNTSVWPGDTIGLSTLSASDVVVSWGSATPSTGNKQSQIFAVHVRAQFH